MKIELNRIPIREAIAGYKDNAEKGVTAFKERLNIRPPYQREFVYKDKQRNAVIETIKQGFPLNVMYWMKNDYGLFEVLDGQQRTISIGQYINGDFTLGFQFFHNLTVAEQNQILDYELMVYICEGTDKERLDWFRTINISGEKLTDQELRNTIFTGPWLADAKLKFSKSRCVAFMLASDGGSLLTGTPIRQDYLETVLDWISDGHIEEYMAAHQHDTNADELWNYFQNVITWARRAFPDYRKEMASVQWGQLYNRFKDVELNPRNLAEIVVILMRDDDVTKKSGIYPYIFEQKESLLSIRAFTDNMKREAYERQEGICPVCKQHFEIEGMEADHITPWCEGGRTIIDNCQMLCKDCNRRKSNK